MERPREPHLREHALWPRYEAEEKVKARERQSELNHNAEVLTAHVQEATTDIDPPKGESAAIIAGRAPCSLTGDQNNLQCNRK